MSASLTQHQTEVNQARQAATLQQIQNLQNMEKSLYQQLEAASAAGKPSVDQDAIIDRINALSKMRIELFESLDSLYTLMQGRVAQSRVDLVDQMTVARVAEQQMNQAKVGMQALTDERNNNMRMVEINTYYGDRYRAHTGLMKMVIIVALVILVLAVIRRQTILPVPENIMNGLIGLALVIGVIILVKKIFDLSSRSNMNYREYDWNWSPEANEPTVIEYDKEQLGIGQGSEEDAANTLAADLGLGCVGSACCSEGTKWDDSANKCVEGFATLGGSADAPFKVSYIEGKDAQCPSGPLRKDLLAYNSMTTNYVGV